MISDPPLHGTWKSAMTPAISTFGTAAFALAACGAAESLGLLRALGGRFLAPGPAGAPARGRLDVLPTGRNLYAIDPRSAPTRNAWEIGRRAAEEICKRYAQDRGEWPKRIVLDLWGSATMRTGGDDLALVSFILRSVADNARRCATIVAVNSSRSRAESRAGAPMILRATGSN